MLLEGVVSEKGGLAASKATRKFCGHFVLLIVGYRTKAKDCEKNSQ